MSLKVQYKNINFCYWKKGRLKKNVIDYLVSRDITSHREDMLKMLNIVIFSVCSSKNLHRRDAGTDGSASARDGHISLHS